MRNVTREVLSVVGAAALVGLGASCVEQADDKPTDDDLKTIKQNILTTAPTPKYAVNAELEDKLVYLGLDVSQEPVETGKDVKLTHYWKVVKPPGDGWRLFVHVAAPGRGGNINFDHGPIRGKYPVAQWKAGEIIRDEHTIRLPATFAGDKMVVYVGIWKGSQRLKITKGQQDGENRVIAATIPVSGGKAPAPRKRYVVRKTTKPIKLDGKLDEDAWKDASSTGAFVNTMTAGVAEQKTEAKMLWDDKFLYVAFDNEDKDVWAQKTKRDDKLWQDEADELMIDADGDGKTYVELQVAPNGTLFDTYLPEYRKYEDTVDPKRKPYDWNSGTKVAVKVDGTLNKRDDEDKGWTVEMAIPLEDVKGLAAKGPRLPPQPGDVWRANLYRMDVPKGKGQQAWGWSPPMIGDFHALDKFGELVFGDDKGQVPPAAPKPASAPAVVPASAVAAPPAASQAVGSAPGPAAAPAGPHGPPVRMGSMRSPMMAPATGGVSPGEPVVDVGIAKGKPAGKK